MKPEVLPWLDSPSKPASPRENLPDDLAANHDFYLHGQHKQQPRRGRWIPADAPAGEPTAAEVEAFNRTVKQFAAEIEGLPADLSANLDRYLHGPPKV